MMTIDLTNPVVAFGATIYLSWCFVNGLIAEAKSRDAGAVILASMLLTPLIGYLYIHGMPAAQVRGKE